jgi:hypothetical protein
MKTTTKAASGKKLISREELTAKTGWTDRQHRQIAKEGFFPAPVRGFYQREATLEGLICYLVDKRNNPLVKSHVRVNEARALKIEKEIAATEKPRGVWVDPKSVGAAVQEISRQCIWIARKEFGAFSAGVDGTQAGTQARQHLVDDYLESFHREFGAHLSRILMQLFKESADAGEKGPTKTKQKARRS